MISYRHSNERQGFKADRAILILIIFIFSISFGYCQETYQKPTEDLVKIIDAPWNPRLRLSPDGKTMALVSTNINPPIEALAEPVLKLAELKINPNNNARSITVRYEGITLKDPDGDKVSLNLPPKALTDMPLWNSDSTLLAFTVYENNRTLLYAASAKTKAAKRLGSFSLNYTTCLPFRWAGDNRHLLALTVPDGRKDAPAKSSVPTGPIVEETAGVFSQMYTFQGLLKSPYDDELFEYYCTGRLILIDAVTGESTPIGEPRIFLDYSMSPDQQYILTETLEKPYSHRVPYYYFKRTIQVWDRHGNIIRTIAQLPASEEVPRFGVPMGPRSVQWQPLKNASLFWVEALDGGNPNAKADFRDQILSLDAPFDKQPKCVLRLNHRFYGIDWLNGNDQALISQYDRMKKWVKTYLADFSSAPAKTSLVFDRSSQDDYNNPGSVVTRTLPDGSEVALQDGDEIYLAGKGASKEGDRPFLRRLNLKTMKTVEIYRSKKGAYEEFIDFFGNSRDKIIIWHQSPADYPNFFLVNLKTGSERLLTDFTDPYPPLKELKSQIVSYRRADGVPLSGILYLPPGYKKGRKLPLIMWAYPREYNDPSTAGQTRGSPYMFPRLYWSDPKFFLLKGYAFFQGSMPVVGNPEQVNNTFKQQIVANARAAVDHLDSLGYIDKKRVLIGGHSYGAFMTAHLLAHCDIFSAGIARSGAYNRTLTPFGFQSERRSFWEAPEFYLDISPITHANKIKKPILIIHGQQDSNPGTYPLQSERLFQAIKGNGGTARLVMLPLEDHHYYARESNLHVLYEMLRWADKYLK